MLEKECKFCTKIFKRKGKYKAQIFCSNICSNRFNLNNKRFAKLPNSYNKELAEFFGILLGDGSVTKYFVKIYLNQRVEVEYSKFVEKLAKRLFQGVSVTRVERINRGTIEVQISSKDVCDYLIGIGFDPRGRFLPQWITENDNLTRATLRGLFDTEGTVGFKFFKGLKGNYFYKQLTITNTNRNILEFVGNALIRFGYKPNAHPRKNIYISNKADIEEYLRKIGSSNPKLINKLKINRIGAFSYGGGLRRMVRQQS